MSEKPEQILSPKGTKDPGFRRRVVHTLVLSVGFMFLGLREAQHASAFLDLAEINNSTLEEASVFYTSLSGGSLVGVLVMGVMFDKFPQKRFLLLTLASFLTAITTVAIPLSSIYQLTVTLFFVNAIFSSACDTGLNSEIISTWGVKGKVPVQAFHFCYSLGSILSPLTVEPFLAKRFNASDNFSIAFSNTTSWNTSGAAGNYSLQNLKPESQIHYAYLIAGSATLVSGVLICAESCLNKPKREDPKQITNVARNTRILPRRIWLLVVSIISCMYFFHAAAGTVITEYIMVFFVWDQNWTKERSARLSAVFWTGVAAARLLGVFVIKALTPVNLLFLCFTFIICGIVGLWCSVLFHSDVGIWISMIAFALGFALVFPTGIVYLERNVLRVTGLVTAIILVAVRGQGIINPIIVGTLMTNVSRRWYIYIAFLEACACVTIFLILLTVTRFFLSNRFHQPKETIHKDPNNTGNADVCKELDSLEHLPQLETNQKELSVVC